MEPSTDQWLNLLPLVLILGLATWRVARFITYDTLIQNQREWLVLKLVQKPEGGFREKGLRYKISYLIGCPYCTGVWTSVALTAFATQSFPWSWGVTETLLAASVSGCQAILHTWTDGRG